MRALVILLFSSCLLNGCHIPAPVFLDAKAIHAPKHGKKGTAVNALVILSDWCLGVDPNKVHLTAEVNEGERRVHIRAFRPWPEDAGCSGYEEYLYRDVGVPVSFVPRGHGEYSLEYSNSDQDSVGTTVIVYE